MSDPSGAHPASEAALGVSGNGSGGTRRVRLSTRDWPILIKLLAMVGAVLVMTTALVVVLADRAGEESSLIDNLANQEVYGLGKVLNIDRDVYQAALGLSHAASAREAEHRAQGLAFYDENIVQTETRLSEYLAIENLSEERRALAEEAVVTRAAYAEASERARRLIEAGVDSETVHDALEESEAALDAFRVHLDALEQSHDQQRETVAATIGSQMDSTRRIALFGLLLVLVTGGLLAWLITRQITRPLVLAVQKTERLAQGDLTVEEITHEGKSDIDRGDEVGRLVRSFNVMLTDFRDLIARIRAVSESVAGNAGEIAGVAHESASAVGELDDAIEQIANAAQQQAHRSQEVAGVVGDISASTSEVSAAAAALAASAETSVAVAREGSATVATAVRGIRDVGERVGETARTVEALQEQSDRIDSIVETILEIAK